MGGTRDRVFLRWVAPALLGGLAGGVALGLPAAGIAAALVLGAACLVLVIPPEDLVLLFPLGYLSASLVVMPWVHPSTVRWGPVPAGNVPVYAAALLVMGGWLWRRGLPPGRAGLGLSTDLAPWVILAWASLSGLWAPDRQSWLLYLGQWWFCLAIIFWPVSRVLADERSRAKFFRWTLACLGLVAAFGLIKLAFGYPDANPVLGLSRNAVVFPFVAFLPLLIVQARRSGGWWWLAVAVVTADVLLIYCRSGYAGLLAGLVALEWLRARRNPLRAGARLAAAALVATVAVFGLVQAAEFAPQASWLTEAADRVTQVLHLDAFVAVRLAPGELDYRRAVLVQGAVSVVREHWLLGTGVGLDNYLHAFPAELDVVPARSHTLYLSYLGELGVIGYAALMTVLFGMGWAFWRRLGRLDGTDAEIGQAFLAGHVAVLVAFVGNEFVTTPMLWVFWAAAAAHFGHAHPPFGSRPGETLCREGSR